MKATLELNDYEFESYKLAMSVYGSAYNVIVPITYDGYGGETTRSDYGNFYLVNPDTTSKILHNKIEEYEQDKRRLSLEIVALREKLKCCEESLNAVQAINAYNKANKKWWW